MSRSVLTAGFLLPACIVLAAPAPNNVPWVTGWEKPLDPDKDSKFIRDKDTLTIEVPGRDHDFDPKRKRFNAPRLLRDVEGDFVMQVRVRGTFRPSAASTTEGMPSWIAAGLLLKSSDKDCIQWEYAASRGKELAAYTTLRTRGNVTIHLEGNNKIITPSFHMDQVPRWKREGKPANPRAEESESIYLRLERDGQFLRLLSSPDGEKWERHFKALKNVELANLPAKIKVGLAAYSTSSEPFKVRFDQFNLVLGKKKEK